MQPVTLPETLPQNKTAERWLLTYQVRIIVSFQCQIQQTIGKNRCQSDQDTIDPLSPKPPQPQPVSTGWRYGRVGKVIIIHCVFTSHQDNMPVFFLSSRLSYLSYRRYARLIFLRFLFIQSHTLNCSMIHATVISSYRHMLFLLFFYNPIKAVKLQISLIFHRFFSFNLLFLIFHEPFSIRLFSGKIHLFFRYAL